jgi:hypothetical protein
MLVKRHLPSLLQLFLLQLLQELLPGDRHTAAARPEQSCCCCCWCGGACLQASFTSSSMAEPCACHRHPCPSATSDDPRSTASDFCLTM